MALVSRSCPLPVVLCSLNPARRRHGDRSEQTAAPERRGRQAQRLARLPIRYAP